MKIKDFIKLYKDDAILQTMVASLKPNEDQTIQFKGLVGSLDAIAVAVSHLLNHQNQLIILHDKEEAAYFQNDLQNLLDFKEPLLFPTSYKRPYQFDDIENANVFDEGGNPQPHQQQNLYGRNYCDLSGGTF